MSESESLVDKLARLVDFSSVSDTETSKQSFIRHVMNMHDQRQKIPRDFLALLLKSAEEQNRKLDNVISVSRDKRADDESFRSSVTVIGDLHGQYRDFETIIGNPQFAGLPGDHNKLVFNGDIVDRGDRAVEILSVVLLSQVLFPDSVYFLRGNHEGSYLTRLMGFKDEVIRKYDEALYHTYIDLFATLPLAAVIQNEVFVTHGGISRRTCVMTIAQLNNLNRFKKSDSDLCNALYELLWADLTNDVPYLGPVSRGGAVRSFGKGATERFLALNGLKLLVRSHQTADESYELHHGGQCVTVFSASNYMNCGNLGAVARFDHPQSMAPRFKKFWTAAGWSGIVSLTEVKTVKDADTVDTVDTVDMDTVDTDAVDSNSAPVSDTGSKPSMAHNADSYDEEERDDGASSLSTDPPTVRADAEPVPVPDKPAIPSDPSSKRRRLEK